MNIKLNKEDQAEVVLSGFMSDKISGSSISEPSTIGEIASSFDVTPEEIRAYFKDKKPKLYNDVPDSMDGTYLLEENGKFVFFSQERGGRSNVTYWNTKEEAENAQVENAIRSYEFLKGGVPHSINLS